MPWVICIPIFSLPTWLLWQVLEILHPLIWIWQLHVKKIDVPILSKLKIINQRDMRVSRYIKSFCLPFSTFRLDITISRVNQFRIDSTLSSSQVFSRKKWNWMTNCYAISFDMREPKSADCSSKKRRQSLSVLVYSPLVVDIISRNNGVFSFALFSEASTAVLIPPNSNSFSDWRRTCHVSKRVTWSKHDDSLGRKKLDGALGQQELELSPRTWSGRALLKPQQICLPAASSKYFFTQSWQLNCFKQELKKKLSSFYTIKAPNLLARRPTIQWERNLTFVI